MSEPKYTVVIQWSELDNCYIASFPEWANHAHAHAHGSTYEEAARNAAEVLELLLEGETDVPAPNYFGDDVSSAEPGSATSSGGAMKKTA